MRPTNAAYQTIIANENHTFSARLIIDKVSSGTITISSSDIISLSIDRPGMSGNIPTVGGALCSTVNATFYEPSNFSMKRMATIQVDFRATDGTNTSDWFPAGTFYCDTRTTDTSDPNLKKVTITGYDVMAKAEQEYPSTDHDWPYKDILVINEIASTIGVTVDPRVSGIVTGSYMVDLPIGYSMREVLGWIASRYVGNFVITADNLLTLVPIYGFTNDPSGYYLADESGNAITLGSEGWCILV